VASALLAVAEVIRETTGDVCANCGLKWDDRSCGPTHTTIQVASYMTLEDDIRVGFELRLMTQRLLRRLEWSPDLQ
jgi:hypothetical protein